MYYMERQKTGQWCQLAGRTTLLEKYWPCNSCTQCTQTELQNHSNDNYLIMFSLCLSFINVDILHMCEQMPWHMQGLPRMFNQQKYKWITWFKWEYSNTTIVYHIYIHSNMCTYKQNLDVQKVVKCFFLINTRPFYLNIN